MSATVDADGNVYPLDGRADAEETVTKEDVQNPDKLARAVSTLQKDAAALKRRFHSEYLDFEDVVTVGRGQTLRLAHNFGGRVRWSVVEWKKRRTWTNAAATVTETALVPKSSPSQSVSYLQYDHSVGGTWTNASSGGAPGFTVGQVVRMRTLRDIIGLRIAWTPTLGNPAYSIKCTIYRASNSAVLATKTISVSYYGFYDALFDTPISMDLTGEDVALCYYETTGLRVSYSTDTTWSGVQVEYPDYAILDHAVDVANDAHPSAHRASRHYQVEPIFGDDAGPSFVEDAATDDNTLVLKGWVSGRATIRVEAAS